MWTPTVSNKSIWIVCYLQIILYQLDAFHFRFFRYFFIWLASTVLHTSSLNLVLTIKIYKLLSIPPFRHWSIILWPQQFRFESWQYFHFTFHWIFIARIYKKSYVITNNYLYTEIKNAVKFRFYSHRYGRTLVTHSYRSHRFVQKNKSPFLSLTHFPTSGPE